MPVFFSIVTQYMYLNGLKSTYSKLILKYTLYLQVPLIIQCKSVQRSGVGTGAPGATLDAPHFSTAQVFFLFKITEKSNYNMKTLLFIF